MRNAVLCFLVKREEGQTKDVLLAMKKRGFGQGKWNAPGGKIEDAKNEDWEEAVARETKEEIGVNPVDLYKVAELTFLFPNKKEWNQLVHVYICEEWEGEPKESEEMKPQWFKKEEIPYNNMFGADIFWVPKILSGKKVKVIVVYDNDYHVLDQTHDTVEKL